MQSNTNIWIYKIEALEHLINTNVVNNKLNIPFCLKFNVDI